VLLFAAGVTRADSPVPVQASWSAHDLRFSLQNLPHSYSCEELRGKLQDVLLQLGARPTPQVSVSRCERALGSAARSPRARLLFELPRLLVADQPERESFPALRKRVRLAAGEPNALESHDCALLRQINRFVLPRLPMRIVEFNLACVARAANSRFRVVVEVLAPVHPP
jgi:hypothetical protein